MGIEESIRHPPPDDEHINPRDQIFQQIKFGRNLRPANKGSDRTARLSKGLFQMGQFVLHQSSRRRRTQAGQCLGRGMGAVRGGKGIIDITLTQGRQFTRKSGIVGLFARVKPQVFQQDNPRAIFLSLFNHGGGGRACGLR